MSTGGGLSIAAPRVLIPFALVTLVWGSTWLVIRDQLAVVPPSWSVTYRFALAAAAMFILAGLRGQRLAPSRASHGFALLLGLAQFALNFNLVYHAEQYVTSGIVALVFALLMIPNSLFAWAFLKQKVTRGFVVGSLIAVAGVALLLVNEYRASPVAPAGVLLGIGFTLCGVIAASAANVMQASERAKRLPMFATLAWAMFYGAILDGAWAWATTGPPVIEQRAAYLAGIAYLGLIGSALTFPLYFGLVRDIGPAKAAYTGVLIPVIAMLLSTVFEEYRWTPLAIAGVALALAGLVIALRARRTPLPQEAGEAHLVVGIGRTPAE